MTGLLLGRKLMVTVMLLVTKIATTNFIRMPRYSLSIFLRRIKYHLFVDQTVHFVADYKKLGGQVIEKNRNRVQ